MLQFSTVRGTVSTSQKKLSLFVTGNWNRKHISINNWQLIASIWIIVTYNTSLVWVVAWSENTKIREYTKIHKYTWIHKNKGNITVITELGKCVLSEHEILILENIKKIQETKQNQRYFCAMLKHGIHLSNVTFKSEWETDWQKSTQE